MKTALSKDRLPYNAITYHLLSYLYVTFISTGHIFVFVSPCHCVTLTCPQFLQWCRRRVSVKVFVQEWQLLADASGTQLGRSTVMVPVQPQEKMVNE